MKFSPGIGTKIGSGIGSGMCLLLALLPFSAAAIDASQVPKKRQTPYGLYLTPVEAHTMKQELGDEILFIDVRTRAELKYVGIAEGIDAHVPARFFGHEFPWKEKSSTYRTQINDHFIADLDRFLTAKNLDRNMPIMLICQSGGRSTPAIKKMYAAGFAKVYNVYEGFEGSRAKSGAHKGKRVVNGWINAGLPWTTKLKKEVMYFNYDTSKVKASD